MSSLAHMSNFEKTLFSGSEWVPKASCWLVLQLNKGIIYLRSPQSNKSLSPGEVVVMPPNSAVSVLVSVLGSATLHGFSVKVSSLSGILTSAERICMENEAVNECAP